MQIEKIRLNGTDYDIAPERYIVFKKADEIIAQNHIITLTVAELIDWYNTPHPEFNYFTFNSDNKKLQLYTSRGSSIIQNSNIVYLMDSISDGLSKEDWDSLNDDYQVSCTDADKITIYYGN